MRYCSDCGERLARVHRSFLERFGYMAIYQCSHCDKEEYVPRRYMHHFGNQCRCPKCGTYRVAKLKGPDQIDPMNTGLLNWMERLAGGSLYYCCFCRLQFYDRRKPAPRNAAAAAGEPDASPTKQDTAKSGA